MPNDQNSSQGRRPHYHRGRRGGDRRATERRTPPAAPEPNNRDQVDVEQIMRDIRARISARHGIDLTPQQIQELASRRLEAILEPRHVKPALLEQMRRAAGEAIDVPVEATREEPPFDEQALYESHRGFLNTLRRLLNPILKLFFNPAPIAHALSAQAERNNAAAQREAELYARQAEWNALHFEIVQRLVTEVARTTLENQSLLLRMEALDAKLDFNDRRVRTMELSSYQSRPSPRPVEQTAEPATQATTPPSPGAPAAETGSGDSARRRRRRRRGRRSGVGPAEGGAAAGAGANGPGEPELESDVDGDEPDAPETSVLTEYSQDTSGSSALEPAHHFSLLQPAERYPSADAVTPPTETPAASLAEQPHTPQPDGREQAPEATTSNDEGGSAPDTPPTRPSDTTGQ